MSVRVSTGSLNNLNAAATNITNVMDRLRAMAPELEKIANLTSKVGRSGGMADLSLRISQVQGEMHEAQRRITQTNQEIDKINRRVADLERPSRPVAMNSSTQTLGVQSQPTMRPVANAGHSAHMSPGGERLAGVMHTAVTAPLVAAIREQAEKIVTALRGGIAGTTTTGNLEAARIPEPGTRASQAPRPIVPAMGRDFHKSAEEERARRAQAEATARTTRPPPTATTRAGVAYQLGVQANLRGIGTGMNLGGSGSIGYGRTIVAAQEGVLSEHLGFNNRNIAERYQARGIRDLTRQVRSSEGTRQVAERTFTQSGTAGVLQSHKIDPVAFSTGVAKSINERTNPDSGNSMGRLNKLMAIGVINRSMSGGIGSHGENIIKAVIDRHKKAGIDLSGEQIGQQVAEILTKHGGANESSSHPSVLDALNRITRGVSVTAGGDRRASALAGSYLNYADKGVQSSFKGQQYVPTVSDRALRNAAPRLMSVVAPVQDRTGATLEQVSGNIGDDGTGAGVQTGRAGLDRRANAAMPTMFDTIVANRVRDRLTGVSTVTNKQYRETHRAETQSLANEIDFSEQQMGGKGGVAASLNWNDPKWGKTYSKGVSAARDTFMWERDQVHGGTTHPQLANPVDAAKAMAISVARQVEASSIQLRAAKEMQAAAKQQQEAAARESLEAADRSSPVASVEKPSRRKARTTVESIRQDVQDAIAVALPTAQAAASEAPEDHKNFTTGQYGVYHKSKPFQGPGGSHMRGDFESIADWLSKNKGANYDDMGFDLREDGMRSKGTHQMGATAVQVANNPNGQLSGVRGRGSMGDRKSGMGTRWLDAATRAGLYGSAATVLYGGTAAAFSGGKFIGDYEEGLNKVRRVMNPLGTDMRKMSASAQALAREFGLSTIEVAKGMEIFAQQGLSQTEVINRTRVAMLAANVTTLNVTQSTEALTAASKQFNIPGNDFMRILDSWNEVENTTAVNTEVLTKALMASGTAAKNAGFGFDDFNGVVAAVGESTRKSGEEVGTSLRFIFQNMRQDQAVKALQQVGIYTRDAMGNLASSKTVLGDLAGKWSKLTDAQRQNTSISIAGTRHANDFMVLMERWDRGTDIATTSLLSQGSALRENAVTMETFNKKSAQLGAQWESFLVKLGDSGGLDALKAIVKMLSDALSVLEKINSVSGGTLGGMGGTVAAGGAAMGLVGANAFWPSLTNFTHGAHEESDDDRMVRQELRRERRAKIRKQVKNGEITGMPSLSAQPSVIVNRNPLPETAGMAEARRDQEANQLLLARGRREALTFGGVGIATMLAGHAGMSAYNAGHPDDGSYDPNRRKVELASSAAQNLGLAATMFRPSRGMKQSPLFWGTAAVAATSFAGSVMGSNRKEAEAKSPDSARKKQLDEMNGLQSRLDDTFSDMRDNLGELAGGKDIDPRQLEELRDRLRLISPEFKLIGESSTDLAKTLNENKDLVDAARQGLRTGRTGAITTEIGRLGKDDEFQKLLAERSSLQSGKAVSGNLSERNDAYNRLRDISVRLGRVWEQFSAAGKEAGKSRVGTQALFRGDTLDTVTKASGADRNRVIRQFLSDMVGQDVSKSLSGKNVERVARDGYLQEQKGGSIFRLSDYQEVAKGARQITSKIKEIESTGGTLLRPYQNFQGVAQIGREQFGSTITNYTQSVNALDRRNQEILGNSQFSSRNRAIASNAGVASETGLRSASDTLAANLGIEKNGAQRVPVTTTGADDPHAFAEALKVRAGQALDQQGNPGGASLNYLMSSGQQFTNDLDMLQKTSTKPLAAFLESGGKPGKMDKNDSEDNIKFGGAFTDMKNMLSEQSFIRMQDLATKYQSSDSPESREELRKSAVALIHDEVGAGIRDQVSHINEMARGRVEGLGQAGQNAVQALGTQYSFEKESGKVGSVQDFLKRDDIRPVVDQINQLPQIIESNLYDRKVELSQQQTAGADARVVQGTREKIEQLTSALEALRATVKDLPDRVSDVQQGPMELADRLSRVQANAADSGAFGVQGMASLERQLAIIAGERDRVANAPGVKTPAMEDFLTQANAAMRGIRLSVAQEGDRRERLSRGAVQASGIENLSRRLGLPEGQGANEFMASIQGQVREKIGSLMERVGPKLGGDGLGQFNNEAADQIAEAMAPIREMMISRDPEYQKQLLMASPGQQALAGQITDLIGQGAAPADIFGYGPMKDFAKGNPLFSALMDKSVNAAAEDPRKMLEFQKRLPDTMETLNKTIEKLIGKVEAGGFGGATKMASGSMALAGTGKAVDHLGRIAQDGTPAILHQGEIVLNKKQSDAFMKNKFASGTMDDQMARRLGVLGMANRPLDPEDARTRGYFGLAKGMFRGRAEELGMTATFADRLMHNSVMGMTNEQGMMFPSNIQVVDGHVRYAKSGANKISLGTVPNGMANPSRFMAGVLGHEAGHIDAMSFEHLPNAMGFKGVDAQRVALQQRMLAYVLNAKTTDFLGRKRYDPKLKLATDYVAKRYGQFGPDGKLVKSYAQMMSENPEEFAKRLGSSNADPSAMKFASEVMAHQRQLAMAGSPMSVEDIKVHRAMSESSASLDSMLQGKKGGTAATSSEVQSQLRASLEKAIAGFDERGVNTNGIGRRIHELFGIKTDSRSFASRFEGTGFRMSQMAAGLKEKLMARFRTPGVERLSFPMRPRAYDLAGPRKGGYYDGTFANPAERTIPRLKPEFPGFEGMSRQSLQSMAAAGYPVPLPGDPRMEPATYGLNEPGSGARPRQFRPPGTPYNWTQYELAQNRHVSPYELANASARPEPYDLQGKSVQAYDTTSDAMRRARMSRRRESLGRGIHATGASPYDVGNGVESTAAMEAAGEATGAKGPWWQRAFPTFSRWAGKPGQWAGQWKNWTPQSGWGRFGKSFGGAVGGIGLGLLLGKAIEKGGEYAFSGTPEGREFNARQFSPGVSTAFNKAAAGGLARGSGLFSKAPLLEMGGNALEAAGARGARFVNPAFGRFAGNAGRSVTNLMAGRGLFANEAGHVAKTLSSRLGITAAARYLAGTRAGAAVVGLGRAGAARFGSTALGQLAARAGTGLGGTVMGGIMGGANAALAVELVGMAPDLVRAGLKYTGAISQNTSDAAEDFTGTFRGATAFGTIGWKAVSGQYGSFRREVTSQTEDRLRDSHGLLEEMRKNHGDLRNGYNDHSLEIGQQLMGISGGELPAFRIYREASQLDMVTDKTWELSDVLSRPVLMFARQRDYDAAFPKLKEMVGGNPATGGDYVSDRIMALDRELTDLQDPHTGSMTRYGKMLKDVYGGSPPEDKKAQLQALQDRVDAINKTKAYLEKQRGHFKQPMKGSAFANVGEAFKYADSLRQQDGDFGGFMKAASEHALQAMLKATSLQGKPLESQIKDFDGFKSAWGSLAGSMDGSQTVGDMLAAVRGGFTGATPKTSDMLRDFRNIASKAGEENAGDFYGDVSTAKAQAAAEKARKSLGFLSDKATTSADLDPLLKEVGGYQAFVDRLAAVQSGGRYDTLNTQHDNMRAYLAQLMGDTQSPYKVVETGESEELDMRGNKRKLYGSYTLGYGSGKNVNTGLARNAVWTLDQKADGIDNAYQKLSGSWMGMRGDLDSLYQSFQHDLPEDVQAKLTQKLLNAQTLKDAKGDPKDRVTSGEDLIGKPQLKSLMDIRELMGKINDFRTQAAKDSATPMSVGSMALSGSKAVDGSGRIREDETPAMLHRGEIVLNRRQADSLLRNRFESGSMNEAEYEASRKAKADQARAMEATLDAAREQRKAVAKARDAQLDAARGVSSKPVTTAQSAAPLPEHYRPAFNAAVSGQAGDAILNGTALHAGAIASTAPNQASPVSPSGNRLSQPASALPGNDYHSQQGQMAQTVASLKQSMDTLSGSMKAFMGGATKHEHSGSIALTPDPAMTALFKRVIELLEGQGGTAGAPVVVGQPILPPNRNKP